jgi:hypothetical protein
MLHHQSQSGELALTREIEGIDWTRGSRLLHRLRGVFFFLLEKILNLYRYETCGDHGRHRETQGQLAEVLRDASLITKAGGIISIPGL